ncbi:aldo/keto reductase [Aurantimonas sp. A2-1-M11]|uniref:aldo/keto reductase n=1 Tax=Aurantimonas sp. A2-1-M11 TaxID=3113712 RepID=UPI002F946629
MTTIPKVPLFRDGPEVARLCLGTMMFADRTDEAEAARMLDRYFAVGGNFIDTADSYTGGQSEAMLGRLLKERRADCVLATKVGNPVTGVDGSGGLSPEWIARAAQMSRERLQTETIDLYYLHLDDEATPLDEVIAALGDLIAEGAIRHWGFSNFRAWKIADMIRIADRLGVARPVVAQPYYHMLNRTAEPDYLPACHHFGIGVVPYSPLGRGILTGKYRGGVPDDSRAARGDKRMLEAEFLPGTIEAANKAADHAEQTGRDPGAMAVNWLLANAAVTSILMGPRNVAQLDGYLGAVDTRYDAEDEAVLSALCASGHTPVVGHSDPRYPYRGRVLRF